MADGDGTNTTPEFTLPESFSGNAAFEGIDSIDSLATKYNEVNTSFTDLQSSQPVIPEGPDAYELTVAEGETVNESLMGKFKEWAHSADLPNDKAQIMSNNFNQWAAEAIAADQVEKDNVEKAATDGLKKEWGTEFDPKAKIANDGLQRFYTEAGFDDEGKEAFNEKYGNDVKIIKIFHAIGSMIGESPVFDNDGNPIIKKGPGRTEGGAPMLHNYDKTTGNKK
jgi:hypothetical protein